MRIHGNRCQYFDVDKCYNHLDFKWHLSIPSCLTKCFFFRVVSQWYFIWKYVKYIWSLWICQCYCDLWYYHHHKFLFKYRQIIISSYHRYRYLHIDFWPWWNSLSQPKCLCCRLGLKISIIWWISLNYRCSLTSTSKI